MVQRYSIVLRCAGSDGESAFRNSLGDAFAEGVKRLPEHCVSGCTSLSWYSLFSTATVVVDTATLVREF